MVSLKRTDSPSTDVVHCLPRERDAERLDARKVQLRGGVQLGDELVEADDSVGEGLRTQGHV